MENYPASIEAANSSMYCDQTHDWFTEVLPGGHAVMIPDDFSPEIEGSELLALHTMRVIQLEGKPVATGPLADSPTGAVIKGWIGRGRHPFLCLEESGSPEPRHTTVYVPVNDVAWWKLLGLREYTKEQQAKDWAWG